MNLSLITAIKFRKGRRKSGMVSLISIISTFSIAIGIAALIIGLSAMNGFERELHNRVLSVVPHGQFYPEDGYLDNWREVQNELKHNRHIVSAMPFVNFTGLIENASKLGAVEIEGVDPDQEKSVSTLPKYVLNNQWQKFKADSQQIIIGAGLAKNLAVKERDWVTLLIPVSSGPNQLKPPKRVRLQVIGILELSGSLSNNIALLPLADAQKLLNMGDSVTGVMVNVDNVYQSKYIMSQAALALDENLSFNSWEQTYGFMYRDIQMIREIMYLAMIVVIGVACFNIVSTLVIAVKDKQRDIAILKTLGATNRLIKHTFIWYGIISGLIGSLIGVMLGLILSWQLSSIMAIVESLIGHKILNSNIYFVDFLPSEIHLFDVVIVFITAMLLSLVASYYPAQRACKIDPARVLSSY
ncbi:lipoprotein-releasing ABC transporter permease subunit LolE [Gilliamella sp. B2776]|nr:MULTISPECIES: lipoprotein-releasing ABC transporter permease subunit LolE [unclassified Gilliamella]MCX8649538.1 lipoprotein-releasing ABC transporter permease subunit LolE [Gilliamella sp. B2779]MCX8654582.1 lipoprotein-releasing ABC transporter permease subunit LolE [Gilliamella sp. B2737]MCX8664972.1 lipoprotein-releasing ABC transporter permease subunit LolE [Gilliamella sp. B2887]MCX8692257.1 lipoprotein-releasing ABC transporter permease subunit LolE [Gilliamella sp. B2776]MCX8697568.